MVMIVCEDKLLLDLQLQVYHSLVELAVIVVPRQSFRRKRMTVGRKQKSFVQQKTQSGMFGNQINGLFLDRLQSLS